VPISDPANRFFPDHLIDRARRADPAIGVDKDGMVRALRDGNAVITGKYAGVKDEVRVIVQSK